MRQDREKLIDSGQLLETPVATRGRVVYYAIQSKQCIWNLCDSLTS